MLHARRALSCAIFVNCVVRSKVMSGYPLARKANSEYLHGNRKMRLQSSIATNDNTAYGYIVSRKNPLSKHFLYFAVQVYCPPKTAKRTKAVGSILTARNPDTVKPSERRKD